MGRVEFKMKFINTFRKDPDGSKECNYSPERRDDQCDICLDTTIRDWYIVKSFMRHEFTGRTICFDCSNRIED